MSTVRQKNNNLHHSSAHCINTTINTIKLMLAAVEQNKHGDVRCQCDHLHMKRLAILYLQILFRERERGGDETSGATSTSTEQMKMSGKQIQ